MKERGSSGQHEVEWRTQDSVRVSKEINQWNRFTLPIW